MISNGPICRRRNLHVEKIARDVRSLGNGPVLDPALDLYFWQYLVYSEVLYVEKLLVIPQSTLDAWRRSFMVHADAICWNRTTIPAQFRYVKQIDSDYWCEEQHWERRVLSSLGIFIMFHFFELNINVSGLRSAAGEYPCLLFCTGSPAGFPFLNRTAILLLCTSANC